MAKSQKNNSERKADEGTGKSNRGLASADRETRQRVARMGGEAHHEVRGLAAADPETRERVARMGGEASHGGGRQAATSES